MMDKGFPFLSLREKKKDKKKQILFSTVPAGVNNTPYQGKKKKEKPLDFPFCQHNQCVE